MKKDSCRDRPNAFERLEAPAKVGLAPGLFNQFRQAAIAFNQRLADVKQLGRAGEVIAHVMSPVQDFHELVPASPEDGFRGHKSCTNKLGICTLGNFLLDRFTKEQACQEPLEELVMRDYLIRQGVESADLIVEAESQSTYENAVACRQLLEARGIHKIVLVTDAFHPHRAVGCFRKQGLEVVPCGCRYRAQNYEGRFSDFVPKPWALSYCHKVAHEWLGVAWYLLHDRM